ncbi:hypothetical protein AB0M57_35255 [Streptomyces sp. NPDC051597]|uniref:hypothetical protein n=1 Tax=Streptomyces sp. NPDC051597 TaxID=3155049 RepID=UPI0034132DC5
MLVLVVADVIGDLTLQSGLQHPLGQLLQQPNRPGQLQPVIAGTVDQHRELVGKVEEAEADKERERHETFQKGPEGGKTKPGDTYEPLRPKPGLRPLPSHELGLTVRLTFWLICTTSAAASPSLSAAHRVDWPSTGAASSTAKRS